MKARGKHAIILKSSCILPVAVSVYAYKDGVEEDGAYLDVDLVEFHDKDFRDITTILKLSDTTKDKLTFTVSCLVSQAWSRKPHPSISSFSQRLKGVACRTISDPILAQRQCFVD